MPNKRSPDQKLIAVPLHEDLLAKVDRARGPASRSAWVRKAIGDLLAKMGYDVPEGLTIAPDRVGKGGRPKGATKVAKAKGKS